MLTMAVPVSDL